MITDPELSRVQAELERYEQIFHRPDEGMTRADFERMTADDFREVGASGKRYNRAEVLDVLETRYASPQNDHLAASGFECRKLAENVYLLTYDLVQDGARRTRRSTVWQRTSEGWKMVFHQGTIV